MQIKSTTSKFHYYYRFLAVNGCSCAELYQACLHSPLKLQIKIATYQKRKTILLDLISIVQLKLLNLQVKSIKQPTNY